MNTQLETLKVALNTAFMNVMSEYKISQVVADRTKALIKIVEPHYNEELVIVEVIENLIASIKADPAQLLNDSKIIDGVIHPMVSDEFSAADVLESMHYYCIEAGPEAAAVVAFISRATGEAFLSLEVAA